MNRKMKICQIAIVIIIIIQFSQGDSSSSGGSAGGPPKATTQKPKTTTVSLTSTSAPATAQPATVKSTIPTSSAPRKTPKTSEKPKKPEPSCPKNCSGHGICQFNQRAQMYECICDLWTTGQNCQIAIPLTPIFVHLFLGLATFVGVIFVFCWMEKKKTKKLVIYNENVAFSQFLFENKRVGKVDHEEFKNQTIAIEKEKENAKNQENQENEEKYVHDDDLGSTINTVNTTRQDSTKF